MTVYGTTAGVGSTPTAAGAPATLANTLNGASENFTSGYVELYKAHYGARDAVRGSTLTFAAGNNHATPGTNSYEGVMQLLINSSATASAGVSSGV